MTRNARSGVLAVLVAGLCALGTRTALADVRLPAAIGSHMVVQRDEPITIWGWAEPGEDVTVELAGKTQKAQAETNGERSVRFRALKAGGEPLALVVRGKNEIRLEDILVGDVWIGSGQSNMEWHLRGTHGGNEAIQASEDSSLRLFHVPKVRSKKPEGDVKAAWKVCSPKTAPTFSAVLYHFGKQLREELDVPIGLINSSWGGSPIEPWIVSDKASGGMYNAMIAPLHRAGIRGAIWYQGETNVLQNNGFAYFDKKKALIGGWRKAWGKELPFYFVQIAPWAGRYGAGQLPALWEAQCATLRLPKTGMAVTTDLVDNIGDIHPRNKLDVGKRLAFWALAKEYGKKDLVYSGPLYKGMKVEGDRIRISFAHVGGGLTSRDDKPLSEFQIAGENGELVPAEAEIDGATVVVHAKGVPSPTAVQFGWHKVANPNLMNKEGLPASPFRTSEWRGGTGE